MSQTQLEFEIKHAGNFFVVTYQTAAAKLWTLQSVTLCGYELDLCEILSNTKYLALYEEIRYAINNNCNSYWQERNVAAKN